MNTFVTIEVNRLRSVAPNTDRLSIDVEMTADQVVAVFDSYMENAVTNEAQAAAMAERIKGALKV